MTPRNQLLPAAGCLAAALEVECSEGRDPRELVAAISRILKARDEPSSVAEALAFMAPTPRSRRAAVAVFTALSSDGASRSCFAGDSGDVKQQARLRLHWTPRSPM